MSNTSIKILFHCFIQMDKPTLFSLSLELLPGKTYDKMMVLEEIVSKPFAKLNL